MSDFFKFFAGNEGLVFLFFAVWLAVLTAILFFFVAIMKKRFDRIFSGKGAADLEEVFARQIELTQKMKKDIAQLFEDTRTLRMLATKSIQKAGVVRFNPFGDTGGDQSFAIALLDLEDNGVVLSSLHSREGTRIYAKPIEKGKSIKYPLSDEEQAAIRKAIGENG